MTESLLHIKITEKESEIPANVGAELWFCEETRALYFTYPIDSSRMIWFIDTEIINFILAGKAQSEIAGTPAPDTTTRPSEFITRDFILAIIATTLNPTGYFGSRKS